MINLPNRCQRLISRAEWHTVRLKGASGESEGLRRYDKENLLWQSGLTLLVPFAYGSVPERTAFPAFVVIKWKRKAAWNTSLT